MGYKVMNGLLVVISSSQVDFGNYLARSVPRSGLVLKNYLMLEVCMR